MGVVMAIATVAVPAAVALSTIDVVPFKAVTAFGAEDLEPPCLVRFEALQRHGVYLCAFPPFSRAIRPPLFFFVLPTLTFLPLSASAMDYCCLVCRAASAACAAAATLAEET